MIRENWALDQESLYEYHGNTEVEVITKQDGVTIRRDWLIFNSVEEALDFFNSEGC